MTDARHPGLVYGESSDLLELVDATVGSNLKIAGLAMEGAPANAFDSWVIKPAAALVDYLYELEVDKRTAITSSPVVVLLACSRPVGTEQHAALEASVQAIRGIVQSVTREKAGTWGPINAVVVEFDHLKSVRAAFEFLSGDGGKFTVGSTLDLRSERWSG